MGKKDIIAFNLEYLGLTLTNFSCGPVIYATFANGIAYSFIPGEILTTDTVIDPKISQLVIEMFVKMHKMETGEEKKPGCWARMRKFWEFSPDGFPEDELKARR